MVAWGLDGINEQSVLALHRGLWWFHLLLAMFEDGVKGANVEESLRPRDIAEVLVARLQN